MYVSSKHAWTNIRKKMPAHSYGKIIKTDIVIGGSRKKCLGVTNGCDRPLVRFRAVKKLSVYSVNKSV